jgi:hypothetical protein
VVLTGLVLEVEGSVLGFLSRVIDSLWVQGLVLGSLGGAARVMGLSWGLRGLRFKK